MPRNKVKVEEEEEEGDIFTVEVILAAKVVEVEVEVEPPPDPSPTKKRKRSKSKASEPVQDLVWLYQVKWAGYPEEEATWEPEENLLSSCTRLLGSFWGAVGLDNEDYPLNFEVKPPKSWIKKEKARFEKDWARDKGKKRSGGSKIPEAEESDDSAAEPQSLTDAKARLKKSTKARPPKIVPKLEEEDSDSESSEPLSKRRRKSLETTSERRGSKTTRKKQKSKSKGSTSLKVTPPPLPRVNRPKTKSAEPLPAPAPRSPEPQPEDDLARTLFSSPPASPKDKMDTLPSPSPSPPTPPPPLPVVKRRPFVPAPAPPPPLPVIQRRPTQLSIPVHPQTTPAEGPAGISVKQKLSQNALDFVPLKQGRPPGPSGVTYPHSPVLTGSSTIMHTGFRKTSSSIAYYPQHQEPTLASLNAPASPPAVHSDLGEPSRQDSPPTHVPPADDSGIFHSDTADFENATTDNNATMDVDSNSELVDRFLLSALPAPLAAPYPNTDNIGEVPTPQPPLQVRYAPRPKPQAKKWNWTGPICVAMGGEDFQFQVIIDGEEELRQTNFKFSIALGDKKILRLDSLYDLSDVIPLFKAVKAPAYRAVVSLQEQDGSGGEWSTLLNYMVKKQQVGLIPVHLDKNLVAHMLLHPGKVTACPRVHPLPSSKENALSIVLLPWSLTSEQIQQEPRLVKLQPKDLTVRSRFRDLTAIYKSMKTWQTGKIPEDWGATIGTQPVYQLALRTLGFPAAIFESLWSTTRKWAIVASPASVTSDSVDSLECQLLKTVLWRILKTTPQRDNNCGIKEASSFESADIVLVHIGSLPHLLELPSFKSKIIHPKQIRFYAFGTHPSTHPRFCGVREIYPCGGVVSVTPGVLLQHPFEIMRQLQVVYEHPLWEAYVHPVVVGMIAALTGMQRSDPVDKYPLPFLLRAIAKGQLALLDAPPALGDCSVPGGRCLTWLRDNIHAVSLSEQEALSRGLATFESMMANANRPEWEQKVEEIVTNDMRNMQLQPNLYTSYRRYVVLSNVTTGALPNSIERLLPSQFDVKSGLQAKS